MGHCSDIVIIASHGNGCIYPETYDLIEFAGQLQKICPGNIRLLVLGADIDSICQSIAHTTGLAVEGLVCGELTQYCNEGYQKLLLNEFASLQPAFICTAGNSQGNDFAPAIAPWLNASCITGVTGFRLQDGNLIFEKYVYGGKIKAGIRSESSCYVLTIQSGAFKYQPDMDVSAGNVTRKEVSCHLKQSKLMGIRKGRADTTDITEARIIIAAGNGIGDGENMTMIYDLAGLFEKSAVAGTRTVCDKGWLSYSQQVGVTGATVEPELYIACGISGAIQHIMGMQGAKYVVSINTDQRAAIFNESDLCVIEDLRNFIPLIMEIFRTEFLMAP
jgi:electron transfer flavoprotein alpha subunit